MTLNLLGASFFFSNVVTLLLSVSFLGFEIGTWLFFIVLYSSFKVMPPLTAYSHLTVTDLSVVASSQQSY